MALLDLVKAKVKDDSARLTEVDDFDPAIVAALELYGKHRPKLLVVDADGADSHDLELPEEWVEEFSRIEQVEYPIGLVPATLLDPADWQVYRSPTGPVLRLVEIIPATGESVRLTITVPRLETEVYPGDLDAVASLAASICCETLANLFTQTSDPTIAADVVNYRSKSGEFTKRAKRLSELYHRHLGIDPEGPAPAGMVVAQPAETRRARLTHGRGY